MSDIDVILFFIGCDYICLIFLLTYILGTLNMIASDKLIFLRSHCCKLRMPCNLHRTLQECQCPGLSKDFKA